MALAVTVAKWKNGRFRFCVPILLNELKKCNLLVYVTEKYKKVK